MGHTELRNPCWSAGYGSIVVAVLRSFSPFGRPEAPVCFHSLSKRPGLLSVPQIVSGYSSIILDVAYWLLLKC